MPHALEISLLGGLQVVGDGRPVPVPTSRKARALLAYLASTGRPHRRDRLCQLFWEVPDDPKAALRWSLSKLRKVVDDAGLPRIVADRERVSFDASGAYVDTVAIEARLRDRHADIPLCELEEMAKRLERVFLDGLEGSGTPDFDYWLLAAREDVRIARAEVLRRLANAPGQSDVAAKKWSRLWREIDPAGAAHASAKPTPARTAVAPRVAASRRRDSAVTAMASAIRPASRFGRSASASAPSGTGRRSPMPPSAQVRRC